MRTMASLIRGGLCLAMVLDTAAEEEPAKAISCAGAGRGSALTTASR